ncbi:MAG: tetratricopeptide repeat protein [Deltaproteobacteria bacterium]|nr:tetratricopeptide repeat protein [Deltaproteobacteria bacterium]
MKSSMQKGRLAALCAVVAAVSFALVDDAEAKKKKKKKKADADTEQGTEGDKGETPPANSQKASVQAVTAAGPTIKYELFRKKIEMQVAEKREEQIERIKKLLDLGTKQEDIPNLKFRLAELYYEKSRFFFFRSQEADDKASAAKNESDKNLALEDKDRNNRESLEWTAKALELYAEIRKKYPDYPQMPEVLFALGQSYWNEAKEQEAIEVYTELIKKHKDSPLVSDAWLAFGEFYFNQKMLKQALKAYELAAADKRSRVYGFAIYKQAWCYYNLGEWQNALTKFRATVFYSQMAGELSGENKISLAREAKKDFVKTYAHVGDSKKAKIVIGDLLGEETCKSDECLKLLEQLAGLWVEQGYFDDAASIYKQMILLDPRNSRNPLFQAKVVDMVSRNRDRKATTREARELVELTNKTKKIVEEQKLTGDKATAAKANLEEAATLAEATIRKLAQLWNQEAKKTGQKPTYADSRMMYEDYLRLFPESKFTYEMRFQLGDLYYKLEEFGKAADAYEATVKADPDGKLLVEAANDNILAVEEHLKDLRLAAPELKGDKPATIHPERMKLIEACDRYVKFVPGDKADKLVSVKFKAAKMYYDHNQLDEAMKRFEEIVANNPKAEQAEVAAHLVADVYNLRKDWQTLYDTATRYLGTSDLVADREKLATDLKKFCEYAKFALVQALEEKVKKNGDSLAIVGQAYLDFQTEFPESDNADEALFNASVAFDQSGEKVRAEELRNKLLELYKTSPLRADVQFYIARAHEERAEYDRAGELFLAFAKDNATDKRARDALFNAAVFFAGTGKVKEANELRIEYLEKYGKQKGGEKEAATIYFSMAQDLERAGKLQQAANRFQEFYKKFAEEDNAVEAMWHEAQVWRQLRQPKAAEKVESLIVGHHRRLKEKGKPSPAAADYASRIAFLRVDDNYDKYKKSMKVGRPNMSRLPAFVRELEARANARETVIKTYTSIVTDYQQAWSSIASLYRIASAWDEFVEMMSNIPCPGGLNQEGCDTFKQGMEEKVEPARQSAKKAYEACVAKSNELDVFTEYSGKCVRKLEQLAPEAYPEITEKRIDFSSSGPSLDVGTNDLILKPAVKLAPSGAVGRLEDRGN